MSISTLVDTENPKAHFLGWVVGGQQRAARAGNHLCFFLGGSIVSRVCCLLVRLRRGVLKPHWVVAGRAQEGGLWLPPASPYPGVMSLLCACLEPALWLVCLGTDLIEPL